MNIDWDNYRDGDGHLNLVEIFEDHFTGHIVRTLVAKDYLRTITEIHPITSRQAAAAALATAQHINKDRNETTSYLSRPLYRRIRCGLRSMDEVR